MRNHCQPQATAILLHRLNPEANEARFYLIQVGPSLVDRYAVLRIWGRIGGQQRQMANPCLSAEEARALARRIVRKRLRRGYRRVWGDESLMEAGEA